jgi:hypothetical protein
MLLSNVVCNGAVNGANVTRCLVGPAVGCVGTLRGAAGITPAAAEGWVPVLVGASMVVALGGGLTGVVAGCATVMRTRVS